jgi:hypothetical protein
VKNSKHERRSGDGEHQGYMNEIAMHDYDAISKEHREEASAVVMVAKGAQFKRARGNPTLGAAC